jgi:hypothetical protein
MPSTLKIRTPSPSSGQALRTAGVSTLTPGVEWTTLRYAPGCLSGAKTPGVYLPPKPAPVRGEERTYKHMFDKALV